MTRLARGENPAEITVFVMQRLETLALRFGPSADWDDMRVAFAQALIALNEVPLAARLLTGVSEIGPAMDTLTNFTVRAIREGDLPVLALHTIGIEVQNAFYAAGRGDEFLAETIAGLAEVDDGLAVLSETATGVMRAPRRSSDLAGGPQGGSATEFEAVTDFETAAQRFPRAPWHELITLATTDEQWPEAMDADTRRTIVIDFGRLLHAALDTPKVERKPAEAIKATINNHQGDREGEAWDRMRFIAALGLYDADAANFGRVMARSMRDPEMMAMVVHALIDRGHERRAMEVMEDIPEPKVYGKMLLLGDWPDRAAIDLLIEEITHVTPKTIKKYDPALRVGVAEGIVDLHRSREEHERADLMQKRVDLLRRQITTGYIKPAKKK